MTPAGPKPQHLPQPSLKHPGRWIWLLLAVPVIFGLARLRLDVEVFGLLPPDIPTVQGLVLYQERFANARELIVTLRADSGEKTELAARRVAEFLRARPDLVTTVTWEPPWLEHPEQTAELLAYLWLNQPPEAFSALAERLAPEKLAGLLEAARDELGSSLSPQEIGRLSYDPLGFTRLPETSASAMPSFTQGQELFSSENGRFRILFVQAARELRTYRQCADWLGEIKSAVQRALVQDEPATSSVTVGYTGRPAFVSEVALGMEHDMKVSVGGTAVLISILFWLAHRRLKPLLWLLTLLAVVLGSTLALGGLIYGAINVVSIGFAAILLGLAVDYAVVHYQEALAHPHLSISQIRHAIAPSIFWAALTTIAAFLVLNFGGLPGLGQLGTLVGLGVILAATIMIFEFLPPLFPGRNEPALQPAQSASRSGPGPDVRATTPHGEPGIERSAPRLIAFGVSGLIFIVAATILMSGFPGIDPTANALRPRHSSAYAALADVQNQLNQNREPLWLIVGGTNVTEVGSRLDHARAVLEQSRTNQLISDFTLPNALWPRTDCQSLNRGTALQLASREAVFREAAIASGFTEASLGMMERILETWRVAAAGELPFCPTNSVSRWIFDKFSAITPTNSFALGLVNPAADASTKLLWLREMESALPRHNVWLSGWPLLGSEILQRVKGNLWRLVVPMVVLVLLSLLLAFRRPLEILLSLSVLMLSGLCLLTVMRLAGWSWNLLNLMAIPLVLGTGVDYGIFMQLALRRHGGDRGIAYRSVGRALLLCGGTAIAGFGALTVSSNAGMASLGQVCAVGIAANMSIAIFLLPFWWQMLQRREKWSRASLPATTAHERQQPVSSTSPPLVPSSLYRPEIWRLGLGLVRLLPHRICEALARMLGAAYWRLAPHRRKVVVENLMPALQQNRVLATTRARLLFTQFALKVVDLWRFEAGLPIDHLIGSTSGWHHFEEAQAQKRGILLVTPHLGNWEFGGPMLTKRGVALQVITLAEPGQKFTQLRRASRARWKIETLVIGENPLAFVEIIRKLEEGATIALLIDRPPPPTAVTVELFGSRFRASIAAAELARASGCVLLPVYLPRIGETYQAHILPPIAYDRRALRDAGARRDVTQRIVTAFEPLILRHLDQWYHFVPVWPPAGN